MSEILVNHEAVISEAEAIKETAHLFCYKVLRNVDAKTNIAANPNGKNVFYASQDAVSEFGRAIDAEVQNIKDMDEEFSEWDNAVAGSLDAMVTATEGK